MRRVLCLTVLAWTLGGPKVAAQVDSVSLDEVLRIVREESPAARAIDATVEVAEAEIDVAGVYPNPRFSYVGMARFDGGSNAINGSQHQLWIDVPVLLGTHVARREAAAAAARTARADADLALLELEIEARRAYLALVVATDRAERIAAAREALDGLRLIIAGRADSGAQSTYDVARVDLARARAEAEWVGARADAEAASRTLAALAGRAGWAPVPSGPITSVRASDVPLEELPSVVAARLRITVAEREVHRAEMERVPEFLLGAGTYVTSDGDSVSGYLGLSVPLPVIDTGEAAVRAAESRRTLAIEEHEALVRRAEAALEGALRLLDARRAALEGFDRSAAGRAGEVLAMAEAAYRLGSIAIFELLDAYAARHEIELTRLDLMRGVYEAEIDLLAVVGTP